MEQKQSDRVASSKDPMSGHEISSSKNDDEVKTQGSDTIYEFGSSNNTESTINSIMGRLDSAASSSTPNSKIKYNSSISNISISSNSSSLTISLPSQAIQSQDQSQTNTSQQSNPNFDSHVISERVKNLATQIYQELKRIISRCNYDEDVLSGLMPLIVRVLESLDLALIENQQLQVELELCKDDNEQLVMMFEKEKVAKRATDKKLIESEYAYEEERQQHQQKIESLENIVKMFELKSKNASDQAARLEEKDTERIAEYNKLHDRYSELLKSHCDVMEKVRHYFGADANDVVHLSSLNVPSTMVTSSELTDQPMSHQVGRAKLKSQDNLSDSRGNVSKRSADSTALGSGRSVWNDTEMTLEDASLVVIEDDDENVSNSGDKSHQHMDDRGEQDSESGDKDSITYTSMEREFRKLIQENKDLLKTKNALNVVKDDLIAEVDRLSNVVKMYEQEIKQLSGVKEQLRQKNSTLEADLRKSREEFTKAQQKIKENDEEGVPYSQRKRFSRVEMAKVLMERNNYKEKLIELQDAVRYTEHVRQNKVETEKRSGLWKFFSNLFGAQAPGNGIGSPNMANSRNSSPVVSYHSSAVTPDSQNYVSTGFDAMQVGSRLAGSKVSNAQRLTTNTDLVLLMDADLASDRNRAMRSARDMADRVHAYGWSLPTAAVSTTKQVQLLDGGQQSNSIISNPATTTISNVIPSSYSGSGLQVPVPLYCRPLSGDSLGMRIWCATAIDLSGGDSSSNNGLTSENADQINTMQSGYSGGEHCDRSSSAALKTLEEEVDRALRNTVNKSMTSNTSNQTIVESPRSNHQVTRSHSSCGENNDNSNDKDANQVSTCVWICSTQHSRSKITIIDIKNKPNDVLDSFFVQTYLYCIKSIPGAKSSDLLSSITKSSSPSKTNISDQQSDKGEANFNSILMDLLNNMPSAYKLIKVDKEAEIQLRQRKLRSSISQQASLDKVEQPKNLADRQNVQKFQSSTVASSPTSVNKEDESDAEISRILDDNISAGITTLQKLENYVAHTQPTENFHTSKPAASGELKNLAIDDSQTAKKSSDSSEINQGHPLEQDSTAIIYYQPISTYLPTVWMGGKDCTLYVHSAIGQWKDCVACVKLPDSIIQICHHRGRVFIALANGQLCVFMRCNQTKQWDVSQYLVIDVGVIADNLCNTSNNSQTCTTNTNYMTTISNETTSSSSISKSKNNSSQDSNESSPQHSAGDNANSSNKAQPARTMLGVRKKVVAGIRCLELANGNLWIGYRNMIFIMDTVTLRIRHSFNVVPQMDNQVRQLVSMKDGVFCCLRSDLILRLYSALKPYQHIQDIDIEPLVTRMISPKTFVISRITALKAVDNVLWIGNAHGIILTIPCDLDPQASELIGSSTSHKASYVDSELATDVSRLMMRESYTSNEGLSIARYVPKCDIANAQISFHGHKDAVKFFVHSHKLMLSGGEGYFDFRLNLDDQSKLTSSSSDKSHLILWQLF